MYQALYRKWRPRRFSDVCGQDTVTSALKNELKTGRLSHAYLFTGCRGTGKTTCAKILAKAVNCESPRDGDPCCECAVCRGIDDGSVLDVTEIDAASNNGVDSIRELREEVSFTPVTGKYRVYIIDEVHMLSAGAFNALLKTLEEPPAHVIFILATTEVHKLPATILSRCQRFDFNRIRPEVIADRIRYVAGQEEMTVTDEAAMLLARLADGAMRDALSLLDQCGSVARDITVDTVAAVTGMAGQETLSRLTACVAKGDTAAALKEIDTLYQGAKDMERLCAEWVGYMRNLMVLHSVQEPGELVTATAGEIDRMRQEAKTLGLPAILHMMEVLQNTLERLHSGVSRRVEMEMAVLKLCDPSLDTGDAAILHRLDVLENRVRAGIPAAPTAAATAPAASPAPAPAAPALEEPPLPDSPYEAPAAPTEPAQPAGPEEGAPSAPAAEAAPTGAEEPFDKWGGVLEQLQTLCLPLYGVLADSSAILKDGKLIIVTENAMFKELFQRDNNRNLLKEAIINATGQTYRVGLRHTKVIAKREADPLTQLLQAGRAAGVPISEDE